MRLFAFPVLFLALLASGPLLAQNRASDCIDASRPVYGFEVESSTSVVMKVAPSRTYRVTLARDCPNLARASGVSVANGIPRQVGYRDGRPVWANSVGSIRICGRAGDRLMLRREFEDFSTPQEGCSIAYVEKLSAR